MAVDGMSHATAFIVVLEAIDGLYEPSGLIVFCVVPQEDSPIAFHHIV